jgi:small subunit ribosomal protein S19e
MPRELLKRVKSIEFVDKCSKELKKFKEMQPPNWSKYAKTGAHKKYPPSKEDWWYVRASSILKRIYFHGPIGVSRLRSYYSGRKERGHKPEKVMKGGGAVIRNILKQLEDVGFVEKNKNGKNGRIVSKKGEQFIRKLILEAK